MPSSEPVRFAIVGGGVMSENHVKALAASPDTTLVALADYPRARDREGRAAGLARKHGLAYHRHDYRELLDDPAIEALLIVLPNALHAEVALAAVEAGKHVVIEKPLCLSLADADRLIARAAQQRVIVGYAEELPYCPRFIRAKELVEKKAIGDLFYVKQVEAHSGPYSDWFFDPKLAGGGALMDMGCHSIEYARWMFDKRPVRRVTARMSSYLHGARGPLDDHVVIHLEWDDGRTALLESGWSLHGGMESVSRLQGTRGVLDVDLLRGNGMRLFALDGVLDEGLVPGWTVPEYAWLWENGYPQELSDFAQAIRGGTPPRESGVDGRAVLEIMWAAYVSAAEGRTVELPFVPDPRWTYAAQPWVERARGSSDQPRSRGSSDTP